MSTKPLGFRSASAVLVAAVATFACGDAGTSQSPTEPLATVSSAPAEETIRFAAAAQAKTLVCHYDAVTGTVTDLEIPTNAVMGHLGHGDVVGSCAGACPCFTAEDLALECPSPISAACPVTYSLAAFCEAGNAIVNLGYFEAEVGVGHCYRQTFDPATGDPVVIQEPVTAAGHAACRDLIVGSAAYPMSCPQ